MSEIDRIVATILEADDEGDIKDILGADYQDPPEVGSKEGYVERHDRWADIKIGNDHWCISYLTPVAVYLHAQGVFVTDKYWSQATQKHIKKWMSEIGFGGETSSMPQQDLLNRFKEESAKVKWTKRQAKKATNFRQPTYGLKSSSDDQIDIEPYSEPE